MATDASLNNRHRHQRPKQGSAKWWIEQLRYRTPGPWEYHDPHGQLLETSPLADALKPYMEGLPSVAPRQLTPDEIFLRRDAFVEVEHQKRRMAFGRVIQNLEQSDGSIDFERAHKLWGDTFDQALARLSVSPLQRPVPLSPPSKSRTMFEVLARSKAEGLPKRDPRLERFSTHPRPYQPPTHRLSSPNWDPGRPVGRYSDLLHALQQKDLSNLLGTAQQTFVAAPEKDAWSQMADRLFRSINNYLCATVGTEWMPFALTELALYLRTQSPRNHQMISVLDKLLELADQQPDRYLTRLQETLVLPTAGTEPVASLNLPKALLTRLTKEHELSRAPMPVLDKLVERLGTQSLFKDTYIINRSHLMDTTVTLHQAFASTKKALFIGKEYSSSNIAARSLCREGHRVIVARGLAGLPGGPAEDDETLWDGLFGGDLDELESALSSWIQEAKPSGAHGFHIIDDGADAVLELLKSHPDVAARSTAVEQTRCGARKLQGRPLPLPVVDVAESAVKLKMEAVLIGWSLSTEIVRQIDDWESYGIRRGKEAVLVGYGAVGRATALCMREMGFHVSVLDQDPKALEQARAEGFRTPSRAVALKHASYVLGATGTTSLTADDLAVLKDEAKLFSLSSSTVEFAIHDPHIALQPRDFAPSLFGYSLLHNKIVPSETGINADSHSSRVISYLDKQFLVANSFQPVNFTGAPHAIRPEFIQLTRALLYLGSVISARLPPGVTGLISINHDELGRREQRQIAADFMEQLRAMPAEQLPPFILKMLEESYGEVVEALSLSDCP